MDQLPRLGKRELIFLLLFTCVFVFSVRRGFLLLWVLCKGYVILLWHSLSLPYNHFVIFFFPSDFQWCVLVVHESPAVTEHLVSVESSSLMIHGTFRDLFVLP